MDGKDSLATTIYSSLFEWLIDSINNSLSEGFSETFIGILDIFGFENFKVNLYSFFFLLTIKTKLSSFII